jgi:hypothetical protein
VLLVTIGASSLTTVRGAYADDKVLATDLFDAGVKKMDAGKCESSPVGDVALCEEARDAFRRAFALYPAGLGALRNLAYVEKALGRVASAARSFRELARRAPLDPKPARRIWAEFAQKELATIEPLVPHLTLRVPQPAPTSLRVFLDGEEIASAAWGTALEVDPGAHVVKTEGDATAPFEQRITIATGESSSLDVVLPAAGDATTTKATEKTSPTIATTSNPPREARPPSRLAPLIVTGIGATFVIVGLGLGYAAIQKRKDVCGEHYCDPSGYEAGRSLAKASTVVTSIGAVTLASGIVWYLLSPTSAKTADRGIAFAPYGTADGAGLAAWGGF